MSNIDFNQVSTMLSSIERMIDSDRDLLDMIVSKHKTVDTYEDLKQSGSLIKLYGEASDDYSKVCYLKSGIGEAVMDLRTMRKAILSPSSNTPPSLVKTYKTRIDDLIEQMNDFKESVDSARLGLEAKVRYFNSCTYMQYDRVMGVKC